MLYFSKNSAMVFAQTKQHDITPATTKLVSRHATAVHTFKFCSAKNVILYVQPAMELRQTARYVREECT
jgi:hypothetical protein